MDAQVADSELSETARTGWLAQEKASGRIYRWATIGSAVALVAILGFSFIVLSREAAPGSMLSPFSIALLCISMVALFGTIIILPIYVVDVLGLEPLVIGLILGYIAAEAMVSKAGKKAARKARKEGGA